MSFITYAHPANRLRDVAGNRIKRFWGKVAKGAPNDCWEWKGARDEAGYGKARFDNCFWVATNLALTLTGKPRPGPDQFALHSCDNPPCCNPAHLRWGTKAENAADREERRYGRPADERSDLKARAIELFDQGKSLSAVARELGLSNPSRAAAMLAEHRGKKERENLLQSFA